jgi:hypothetical protein
VVVYRWGCLFSPAAASFHGNSTTAITEHWVSSRGAGGQYSSRLIRGCTRRSAVIPLQLLASLKSCSVSSVFGQQQQQIIHWARAQ